MPDTTVGRIIQSGVLATIICKQYIERGQPCKQNNNIAEQVEPIKVERPHCWKLATVPNSNGEQEEMVLRLQGIICDRNLPPIERPQTM